MQHVAYSEGIYAKSNEYYHAEINLLFKFINLQCKKNKRNGKGKRILETWPNRMDKNGKPCNNCIQKLRKYKIFTHIRYWNGNKFVTEKLNEIKNDHISRGDYKKLFNNKIN